MLSHNQIARMVKSQGYAGGVTTAYEYLKDLASAMGKQEAAYLFSGGARSYGMAAKAARKRLVLHSPQFELTLASKAAGDNKGDSLPAGVSAEIISRVSTVDKDWDGDIVHPEGLVFDQRAPLLWMHAQNMPIGTFRGVVEQDESKAVCRYHTAETTLAIDAVKLFKIGALRNSIGFKTLEADPLGFVDGANGKQVPTGFDIKRAVVLENSAVAVPANPNATVLSVYAKEYDALWSAASNKEFKSDVIKRYAAAVYEKRPTVFKGATLETTNKDTQVTGDAATLEKILTEIKELKMGTEAKPDNAASDRIIEIDGEKSMHWGMDEYADGSHEQAINGVERTVKGYMCNKGECSQDSYPAVMATYGDKAYVCMRKWNGDSYEKKNYQVNYTMKNGKCSIDGHKSIKIAPSILDDMESVVVAKWMEIDGIKTKGNVETAKPSEATEKPAETKQLSLRDIVAKGVVCGFSADDEKLLRETVALLDAEKKAASLAVFC